MDEIDLEIQLCFLEEAQQLLDEVDNSLVALHSGDYSPAQLNDVFRLAHTFKGSASVAGFSELSHFAHKIENVLEKIRSKELNLTPEVGKMLFKSSDLLRQFINGLKKDLHYKQDTKEFEQELLEIVNSAKQAKNQQTNHAPEKDTVTLEHETILGAHPKEDLKSSDHVKQVHEESIRVAVSKLDALFNLVGEILVNQALVETHKENRSIQSEHCLQTITYLTKLISELQGVALSLRMMPLKRTFQKMQRTVKALSTSQNKNIEFTTEGENVELDKMVVEKLGDPLTHLIRNAVDHGIESSAERGKVGKPEKSTVVLRAEQKEESVLIVVSDDGKGLDRDLLIRKAIEKGFITPDAKLSDQEAYALIFKPGFSTRDHVSNISGRGVGMDVVQSAVDEMKGSVEIRTEIGKGTEFRISLPLSLSIVAGLVVSIEGEKYIIPTSQLFETIQLSKLKIETCTGQTRMVSLRGEVVPVLSLGDLLHRNRKDRSQSSITDYHFGLVTSYLGKKVSFEVDEILGQQQIVIKKLGSELEGLPGIFAGAILSNGEPGLLVNLHDFIGKGEKHAAA